MEFIYDEKENKVKLTVNVDFLVNAFNESPYVIGVIKLSKIKKFAKAFVKIINELEDGESGLRPFDEACDKVFNYMQEDDSDFIEYEE